MDILITCQYSTNKGDRAICEYLIMQSLKKGHNVTVSTNNPKLWKSLYKKVKFIGFGTPFSSTGNSKLVDRIFAKISSIIFKLFLRKEMLSNNLRFGKFFSRKLIKSIKKSDLVIVTGGHHITSLRSKNALYDVTYDIWLCSKFSKKFILWTQTIGPLDLDDDRVLLLFSTIFNNCNQVFIRENNSRKIVEDMFHIDKITMSKDTVFGYNSMLPKIDYDDREKRVGISIFTSLKKSKALDSYFAYIADYFYCKGFEISFFKMEQGLTETNRIKQICSLCKNPIKYTIEPFFTPSYDHMLKINKCEYYIGYKTHSIIMALATNTPIFAFAYHPKSIEFMRDFGLEEYCLQDDGIISNEIIKQKLDKLIKNGRNISKSMEMISDKFGKIVERDLNDLL